MADLFDQKLWFQWRGGGPFLKQKKKKRAPFVLMITATNSPILLGSNAGGMMSVLPGLTALWQSPKPLRQHAKGTCCQSTSEMAKALPCAPEDLCGPANAG